LFHSNAQVRGCWSRSARDSAAFLSAAALRNKAFYSSFWPCVTRVLISNLASVAHLIEALNDTNDCGSYVVFPTFFCTCPTLVHEIRRTPLQDRRLVTRIPFLNFDF
jgi:hypothetical protein